MSHFARRGSETPDFAWSTTVHQPRTRVTDPLGAEYDIVKVVTILITIMLTKWVGYGIILSSVTGDRFQVLSYNKKHRIQS